MTAKSIELRRRTEALDACFEMALQQGIFHSIDPYLHDYMMSIIDPGHARCPTCRRLIKKDEFPKQVVFRTYKDKYGYHVIKYCNRCNRNNIAIEHRRIKIADGKYLVLPAKLEFNQTEDTDTRSPNYICRHPFLPPYLLFL